MQMPEPKSELLIEYGKKVHNPNRRNWLLSVTSGLATFEGATLQKSPFYQIANAATSTNTGAKSFRSYHVKPDAGAKLNPTLEELSVRKENLELLIFVS
jgi:hypothetical protein